MKKQLIILSIMFFTFACVSNTVNNKPDLSIPDISEAESKVPETGPKVEDGVVKFTYNADPSASEVDIVGDFNNWKREKMNKMSSGFSIEYELEPGSYQYKFVVDGSWVLDPSNPNTADDGYGGKNSVVTVK